MMLTMVSVLNCAIISRNGGIPKWLKGSVSKTDRWRKLCRGSNPFSSAKRNVTNTEIIQGALNLRH